MKIIMLVGAHNSGKSTALKKVYEELKGDDKVQEITLDPHPNKYDFYSEIMCHGKKIAIATMGDVAYGVEEYFNKANSDKCDWFICANSLMPRIFKILCEVELGVTLVKHKPDDTDERHVVSSIIKILKNEKVFA